MLVAKESGNMDLLMVELVGDSLATQGEIFLFLQAFLGLFEDRDTWIPHSIWFGTPTSQ